MIFTEDSFFALAGDEELLLATVVFKPDDIGFNKPQKRLFVEKTIPLLKKLSKSDDAIINSCYFSKKTPARNADAVSFINSLS